MDLLAGIMLWHTLKLIKAGYVTVGKVWPFLEKFVCLIAYMLLSINCLDRHALVNRSYVWSCETSGITVFHFI